MASEIYYPAPEVAERYINLLPRFRVDEGLAHWAEQYAMGHAGRCLWDAQFLARRFGTGRILNIGGAPYLFEMILKEEQPDLELVTVDLEPGRFPGAGEALGIRVIGGDVESPNWQLEQKFDCIVFAEILEHLRILYLTTPNGLSFWNIFKHYTRGRTGPSPTMEWRKLSSIGHMGHVREYSTVEVTELLTSCNFTIDNVILRSQKDGRWLLRDLVLASRSQFASEMVIVARTAR
jgi:hypothetical protein